MMSSAPASYSFAPAFPPDDHQLRIHLPASSTRLSPASTASDSARSWVSTHHAEGRQRTPSASTTSPANGGDGFEFITAMHPNAFKDKDTMVRVRKRAMNDFLVKNTKPQRNEERRKASLRARQKSDDSSATEQSVQIEEAEDVTPNKEAIRLFQGGKKKTATPGSRASSLGGDDMAVIQRKSSFQIIENPFSPFNAIMNPAPMLEPPRPGKLPFDVFEIGPFKSLGKPLDPFRVIYQSQYACVPVEQLKHHCSQVFGTRAMGIYWIPTLIKSPHAFLSTLCISSAHFDALNKRPVESVQTLALRQEIMHRISQNLVNPTTQVDDFNIIAVTQLICSEIIAGSPTIINYHESGVEKMVAQRGGLDKLGVNGRLAAVLTWVSLQSALIREAKPRKMYMDYANYRPARPYPNTATIPESPFWCPRSDLETIKRSQRSLQRTVDLIKDVRSMTRIFLGDDSTSSPEKQKQREQQLKALLKKIAALPAVADMQATTVLTSREWTYEVCRLTALIQGTAMVQRVPFSKALEVVADGFVSATPMPSPSLVSPKTTVPTVPQLQIQTTTSSPRIDSPVHSFGSQLQSQTFSFFPPQPPNPTSAQTYKSTPNPSPNTPPSPVLALLSHIHTALESSDLSDIWSDLAGVLYWITIVVSAAASPSANLPSAPTISTSANLPAKEKTSLKVLNKWFRALSVRCAIRLCFEHEDGVLATLGRAGRVMEGLRKGSDGTESGGKLREGGVKRRRV